MAIFNVHRKLYDVLLKQIKKKKKQSLYRSISSILIKTSKSQNVKFFKKERERKKGNNRVNVYIHERESSHEDAAVV